MLRMLENLQDKIKKQIGFLQAAPRPSKFPANTQAKFSTPELLQILETAIALPRCEALKNSREMVASGRILDLLGLPSHHDSQKNWDGLKTIYYLLANSTPDAPILDGGSGWRSAVLNWLQLLGYTNLWACDRVPVKMEHYDANGIRFSVEDLGKTNYSDNSFAAISSVSVIEHGVSVKSFLTEMYRILKADGVLTVSTDYWSELIDCSGAFPYGEEYGAMKIFTPHEIEQMVRDAESVGFRLCAPIDYATEEKAVHWARMNKSYTFFFAAFRK